MCMYAHVTHIYVCVCVFECVHAYIQCTHIFNRADTRTCVSVCECVCTYVCIHIYIYILTYIYIFVFTYAYIFMCKYTCVCI